MMKKLLEHFIKKNCKKQTNKNLKVIKIKGNYMSNGTDMIIHLIAELIKNMLNEILSNAILLYKNESIFF